MNKVKKTHASNCTKLGERKNKLYYTIDAKFQHDDFLL